MLEQTSLLQFIIYFSKKHYSESSQEKPSNTVKGSLLGCVLPALEIMQTQLSPRQHRLQTTLHGIALVWPGQIHSFCILWQQEGGLCSINHVEYYLWGIGIQTAPTFMGSYGPLKVRRFPKEGGKKKSIYGWHHLLLAPKQQQMLLLRESNKLLQGGVCSRCEP